MTSANPPRTASSRNWPLRLIRLLLIAILLFLLLPYVLTPLYRIFNPVSTAMLWRWMTGARIERTYVPLDRVAPVLAKTVIVSEDAKFCRHRGIDWGELRAAIEEADELGDVRGASTITQQTVKNLFFWGGRSFVRKALEFPLAMWADLVLPKRRIMEIYLNIAEWGPGGQFGIEAGARRAFAKPARDLNAQEAAIMAAVLPNPYRRNAQRPGPAVRQIAGRIQGRAARAGDLDACLRR
jgi:monofunctional biosynthetic peptidoglycan transglycosylase